MIPVCSPVLRPHQRACPLPWPSTSPKRERGYPVVPPSPNGVPFRCQRCGPLAVPSMVADNAVMGEPFGYLLTWTTYGTWLRGDQRCSGGQTPGAARGAVRAARTGPGRTEPPAHEGVSRSSWIRTCGMPSRQRFGKRACTGDGSCTRSAFGRTMSMWWSRRQPGRSRVAADLKAYASRAIKQSRPAPGRVNWWSEGASTRYLNSEKSLLAAIEYVRNQDVPH